MSQAGDAKKEGSTMKISGTIMALIIATVVITLILAIPIIGIYRSVAHTRQDVVKNPGPWTNLGTVSNGLRSGLVMRRQDPDTGAMIYVLVGTELGGIYVVPAPAEKPK